MKESPESDESQAPCAKETSTSVNTFWPIACLASAMLIASLGVSIPNVALPTLADTFGMPIRSVQWVVLAYLLALTVSIVVVGRLADRAGRRRVFIIGIVLFTVASAICALANALWFLIAARSIQGVGGAVLMALTMAMVRDAIPENRTGRAMGLLGTMSATGTALGPSLGGFLVEILGWPSLFAVLVPLGIVTLLLAALTLPAAPSPAPSRAHTTCMAGSRPDWPGAFVLTLTLGCFLVAVTDTVGLQAALLLLTASAAGLLLFLRIESRSNDPFVPLSVFRGRALSTGMLTNIAVGTAMMATLVVGPFYLAHGLGMSPAQIGLVLSVGPILSAVSGIPAGRAVDRFGARRILLFGLAQMTAASAALAILPGLFGLAGYLGAIAMLTPAYQMVQAANSTAVMSAAGQAERGIHSGLLNLSRNLGLMAGASVMGILFAAAGGMIDGAAPGPNGALAGLSATFGTASALIAAMTALQFVVRIPTESGHHEQRT